MHFIVPIKHYCMWQKYLFIYIILFLFLYRPATVTTIKLIMNNDEFQDYF